MSSTEPVVDRRRLIRAVKLLLWTEQTGPRQFKVRGNDEPEYNVDLDGDPPCYCKDSENRGSKYWCKHFLASELKAGNPEIRKRADELLEEIAGYLEVSAA